MAVVSATPPRRAIGRDLVSSPRVVDGLFIMVLSGLGLLGLRTTFGGSEFLLVGLLGVALGIAVSELARRMRQPIALELAVGIAVFLVVGAVVAANSRAVGGVIPTGSGLRLVMNASIRGWKEILTTAPPIGTTDNLMTIPYLIGIGGGVLGYSLTWRFRLAFVPLLAPIAVLAVGILLGTQEPAALFLQGSVFAGLVLAWGRARSTRQQSRVVAGSRRRGRAALAAAVIAASALAAIVVGPRLPFTGGHSRVTLQQYVVPPFDANSYPSPLSSFRDYTQAGPLADTPLYKVTGLPPASSSDEASRFVRFVTMDGYDGLAWGFQSQSASATGGGDVFRRYGSTIAAAGASTAAVTVDVVRPGSANDPNAQWLPTFGSVESVHFSGPQASGLASDFRYNTDTLTAVDTVLPVTGDSYTLDVAVPATVSQSELAQAAAGSDVTNAVVVNQVKSDAETWAGSTNGAWNKVMALSGKLQAGFYSDGQSTDGNAPSNSLAGNSSGRLTEFLTGNPLVGTQIVGDDEQYAATLALMANYVGVPARVVLGGVVEPDDTIRGKDVQAWVEVQLAGIGWYPVPSDKFERHVPPQPYVPQVQQQQGSSNPVVPPNASTAHLPPPNALPSSSAPSSVDNHGLRPAGFHLPAFVVYLLEYALPPITFLAVVAGAIVVLKGRRRRRRMAIAQPAARFAAAWTEMLDRLREAGLRVPDRNTRREQAVLLPMGTAAELARAADAVVFGPGDPTREDVDAYWDQVDRALMDLRQGWRRRTRIWATLNPITLLPRTSGRRAPVRS